MSTEYRNEYRLTDVVDCLRLAVRTGPAHRFPDGQQEPTGHPDLLRHRLVLHVPAVSPAWVSATCQLTLMPRRSSPSVLCSWEVQAFCLRFVCVVWIGWVVVGMGVGVSVCVCVDGGGGCACVRPCVCACLLACVCACACVRACFLVCVCVCVCVDLCECVCVCVFVRAWRACVRA